MAQYTEAGLTKISRMISYLLRHNPGSAGLKMSNKGEVNLRELAEAVGVSVKTVREIVADDSKGRYVIEGERIWATQGHSIPILVQHEKITELGIVFHGTKRHFLDSIKKKGLVAGDRLHVHLSSDIATAISVANRRVGSSVILEIDGNQLLKDGYEIVRSQNGVILTEYIPWKYVLNVTPIIDFQPKPQT